MYTHTLLITKKKCNLLLAAMSIWSISNSVHFIYLSGNNCLWGNFLLSCLQYIDVQKIKLPKVSVHLDMFHNFEGSPVHPFCIKMEKKNHSKNQKNFQAKLTNLPLLPLILVKSSHHGFAFTFVLWILLVAVNRITAFPGNQSSPGVVFWKPSFSPWLPRTWLHFLTLWQWMCGMWNLTPWLSDLLGLPRC